MELPTYEEIRSRIQADIDYYGGNLPDIVYAAWSGYIGGLLEWSLISPGVHSQLTDLLPPIDNDPMVDIFLGRERD